MATAAPRQDQERPPTPWMQFVTVAFETTCTSEDPLSPSFAAAAVVSSAEPEGGGHEDRFPLRIALRLREQVYLVVAGRAAPPLQFIADVLHTVLTTSPENPDSATWKTPGATLQDSFSSPIAGCFACSPDELAERVVAIIRDHWRRRFGDDDLDDGMDPTEPPIPSIPKPRAAALVR